MAYETEVPPGFFPWGHDDKPNTEPSEYSLGAGLVPRGLEHAAPDDGGMYAAKAPGIAPETCNTRYGYAGRQIRS
jgi:hypothetical protein